MCLQIAVVWRGLSLLCSPSFCNSDSQTLLRLSPTIGKGIGVLLLSLLSCCAGPAAALREV